ncbi:MAG: hypothetical protein CMC88_05905 [Flavobacteriaceae bacterium]|nr:hypothetical protein [Flavobacteriaceae bacterium]|tara:strand:- start:22809 stop:23102 length:294 start_codon:yes stop_codon:yes gene_type:complete
MDYIKNKKFYFGIISGILWTSFVLIIFLLILSDDPIEFTLQYSYKNNKLGGLIALSSLINLPIFFIAIKRNKISFASGLVAFLILLVLIIAFLKLSI